MSTAAEFAWTPPDSKTGPLPLFECAPIGLAQCQRQGNITALNPALEKMLGGASRAAQTLCFSDLLHPQKRDEGERLFRELFERQRDSFRIDSQMAGGDSCPVRWTAWLVPGVNGSPDHALALAEGTPHYAAHEFQAGALF